ncbi:chemotaxis protein, partial [Cronobacter sakazakii]|nr:chemotaxis protein [Cronobacter sakazakii]
LGDAIVKKPVARPAMAPARTLAVDGAGSWETF